MEQQIYDSLQNARDRPEDEPPARSNSEELHRLVTGLEELEHNGGDPLDELSASLQSLLGSRGVFDSLTLSDCKRQPSDFDNENAVENERGNSIESSNAAAPSEETETDQCRSKQQGSQDTNSFSKRGVKRGHDSITAMVPTKLDDGHSVSGIPVRGNDSESNRNPAHPRAA